MNATWGLLEQYDPVLNRDGRDVTGVARDARCLLSDSLVSRVEPCVETHTLSFLVSRDRDIVVS